MRHEASQRNDLVLDLLIKAYIDSAEPVGSRTISRRSDLGLSPASIRNVMADLEEQGFLKQPHTSAGRVPTDQGYRYWVDSLMEPETLSEKERELIQAALDKVRTIDSLAEEVCRLLSALTDNAVVVYFKSLRLFIDGTSKICEQPEFHDITKMRTLLRLFDEKLAFLQALMAEPQDDSVHVRIGHENKMNSLGHVSLVAKDCWMGPAAMGGVAVVGPTRMRYSKVVAVVEYVADSVSERAKGF